MMSWNAVIMFTFMPILDCGQQLGKRGSTQFVNAPEVDSIKVSKTTYQLKTTILLKYY